MEQIDIVIPWVDGSDLDWLKEKNKYNNHQKIENNSEMRYRDWGILKYVLRSIEKNIPWYHKIYLITEGHIPKWLNIECEKIVLVTHKELYVDINHLPVFNSSSIEMNLVNIKNLSKKFIYMNDDFLILKKVDTNRFFINDLPVDFLSHGWIPRNNFFKKLRGMNSWAHALKNNLILINHRFSPLKLDKSKLYHSSYGVKTIISNFLFDKVYKKFLWIEHWHHPQPYLKQTLLDTYRVYNKQMIESSKNRFRENSDLTQYLYRYWQLGSGTFYPYKHNDGLYCKIKNKKDIDRCMKNINKYTFLCLNDAILDDIDLNEYKYIENIILHRLEKLFPQQCIFEKE